MTLGQFFLGAIALAIATVVYRWQKEIDHAFSERAEKRALFGRFLGQLEAVVRHLDSTDLVKSEEFLQLDIIRAQIELVTEGEVIEASANVLSRLYDVQRFNQDPNHSKLPNRESRYGHVLSGQRGVVEAMIRDLEQTVDSKTAFLRYVSSRWNVWREQLLPWSSRGQ